MHRTMQSLRLPAVIVLATVVLAACGGETADSETSFNEPDVTFLQDMVPHHAQATEMAEMAPERTDDPDINTLAEEIIAAQSEEIETMNGLLEQAGEEPVEPMAGMEGMDMGSTDMSGMMSAEQMGELEGLEGEPFVQMWTAMMTEHHRGAIESAQTVLSEGENPEVATLAEEIIRAQEAEIEQMEQIAA